MSELPRQQGGCDFEIVLPGRREWFWREWLFGRDVIRVRFTANEFLKLLRHILSQFALGTDHGVVGASAHQLACTLWTRPTALSTAMRVVNRVRLGPASIWASMYDYISKGYTTVWWL